VKRIYAPWRSEYLRAEKSDECLFCRLAGEEASEDNWVLFQGKRWYVVINTYPYSSGHIMVVCKRHLESFRDLDPEEGSELAELLARAEQAIRSAFNPDGINMGANLGRSAGAGIEGHLHVHLVPRWQGDTNFMTTVGETRVISEDLLDTYRRLKSSF